MAEIDKLMVGLTVCDWRPYPKELPERGHHYLVVVENKEGQRHIMFDFYSQIADCWGMSAINCEEVKYWARPPVFP